jgi:hypothetical protein
MRTTRVLAGFALIASILATAPTALAASLIPAHVYSPYFETWTSDSLATTAQQSGTRFFTMAFLETLGKTSCTLAWNGDKTRTIGSGAYAQDITNLRALGGDVIPSVGGWSADQGGTEIGDSCKSVDSILAAYQSVVTTYNVTRLDMDIEGRSLTKTDGIDRRNKAIKKLQDWAASPAVNRTLTISYTLPTNRNGLPASSLFVLQNAVANGVRIDYVTPMVFDYYDRAGTNMYLSAKGALEGLHTQLETLFQGSKTSAQIWAIEGAIIMNGLDDYPRRTESTSVQDAKDLLALAKLNGMSILSMWAIQRDHGGCDGVTGANNCSGIPQADWEFSTNLNAFTGS